MNHSIGCEGSSIENVSGSIGFAFDSNHKSCISIEKMSRSNGCVGYSIEENCEKLMFFVLPQRHEGAKSFFKPLI
jgi:hypothetical protein